VTDKHNKDFIHKEFPKQFAKDDFWSQIKRTVNGKPVSESDIQLIVNQVCKHLKLNCDCGLLDLGCGNGALASRLFSDIGKYIGVDFSAYLLEIAREYFSPRDDIQYIESDIRTYVKEAVKTEGISRVLIYGCISYLSRGELIEFLTDIKNRFHDVKYVFIGNIPDKDKSDEFYSQRGITDFKLDDPQSPIGCWWGVEEFKDLCEKIGYRVTIDKMPEEFYGSKYRFDVGLSLA